VAGAGRLTMSGDARGAQRLLCVQRQLRRIEEAKLADLQRRLQDIKDEQVSLVGTMNDDGALQGLFLDAMARRLKALAEQEDKVEVLANRQAVAVRVEATKEKAAEKLAKRREAEARALEAQKELDAILELIAHPRDASLR
jgi:hypothetical protein